jgi:hypothetical protein
MNHCPPGPQVFLWGRFEFFQKFAEIFANECLLPGVNDTGDKLFFGVNNTGDKFIGGVVDNGDKTVLPIFACLHLKIKNKQKFYL